MTHTIKLNERFCNAVYDGRKTFEIRLNDRGYQTGDLVKFIPIFDDMDKKYSHPIMNKTYEITYVLSGWGLEKDYVVFSIKEINNDG